MKLHGSGYNGLGLRLPAAWDRVARHTNSEDTPYSAEQKWDVTPAQWAAVSHAGNDHAITVALLGRPSNRGAPSFFSMLNPFAYLSVTQNLEKAPLEYARGNTFSMDYLLLVYADEKPCDFLERRVCLAPECCRPRQQQRFSSKYTVPVPDIAPHAKLLRPRTGALR